VKVERRRWRRWNNVSSHFVARDQCDQTFGEASRPIFLSKSPNFLPKSLQEIIDKNYGKFATKNGNNVRAYLDEFWVMFLKKCGQIIGRCLAVKIAPNAKKHRPNVGISPNLVALRAIAAQNRTERSSSGAEEKPNINNLEVFLSG
jgi:hypothetical protein